MRAFLFVHDGRHQAASDLLLVALELHFDPRQIEFAFAGFGFGENLIEIEIAEFQAATLAPFAWFFAAFIATVSIVVCYFWLVGR